MCRYSEGAASHSTGSTTPPPPPPRHHPPPLTRLCLPVPACLPAGGGRVTNNCSWCNVACRQFRQKLDRTELPPPSNCDRVQCFGACFAAGQKKLPCGQCGQLTILRQRTGVIQPRHFRSISPAAEAAAAALVSAAAGFDVVAHLEVEEQRRVEEERLLEVGECLRLLAKCFSGWLRITRLQALFERAKAANPGRKQAERDAEAARVAAVPQPQQAAEKEAARLKTSLPRYAQVLAYNRLSATKRESLRRNAQELGVIKERTRWAMIATFDALSAGEQQQLRDEVWAAEEVAAAAAAKDGNHVPAAALEIVRQERQEQQTAQNEEKPLRDLQQKIAEEANAQPGARKIAKPSNSGPAQSARDSAHRAALGRLPMQQRAAASAISVFSELPRSAQVAAELAALEATVAAPGRGLNLRAAKAFAVAAAADALDAELGPVAEEAAGSGATAAAAVEGGSAVAAAAAGTGMPRAVLQRGGGGAPSAAAAVAAASGAAWPLAKKRRSSDSEAQISQPRQQ